MRKPKWLKLPPIISSHIVAILAAGLAGFATVLAVAAYTGQGRTTQAIVPTVKTAKLAGFGLTGCKYLEGIAAANHLPIKKCALVGLQVSGKLATGTFRITQLARDHYQIYLLTIGFIRSEWQVLAVEQKG